MERARFHWNSGWGQVAIGVTALYRFHFRPQSSRLVAVGLPKPVVSLLIAGGRWIESAGERCAYVWTGRKGRVSL